MGRYGIDVGVEEVIGGGLGTENLDLLEREGFVVSIVVDIRRGDLPQFGIDL